MVPSLGLHIYVCCTFLFFTHNATAVAAGIIILFSLLRNQSMDISNVLPKTVFSVDELNGSRRFELAISVTVCPGIFSRTKLITLLPRYQIVNLLHRELVIAQDGCLDTETLIPSQAAVPFHWEKGSLAPKVRLGAPSIEEKARKVYDSCWTNGRFRVDRVGITSMRLPTDNKLTKM